MTRVAVLVFPGTNSEDETLRLLLACGANAELVHWSRMRSLGEYAAYVLPGGFTYDDRIRAGAVAARDAMMDAVTDGAAKGKCVLGICNGAQILLEAGLVPGTAPDRRPTAAFTHNAPSPHFICTPVHVVLSIPPSRSIVTAALPENAVLPAWVAHGEGRLAARDGELERIRAGGHVAFTYAHADGITADEATPNGSAFGCAGLVNREGNVLAIMPHVERVYPQRKARPLFESFVKAIATG